MLRALRVRDTSALGEMVFGVFLITVLARLPWCIGFLVAVIIGSIGLGAVVLTRFGTQSPRVGVRPTAGGGPVPPAPPEPLPPAAVEPIAPLVPPAEPMPSEPALPLLPQVEMTAGEARSEAA
jgi:hypothetical protein